MAPQLPLHPNEMGRRRGHCSQSAYCLATVPVALPLDHTSPAPPSSPRSPNGPRPGSELPRPARRSRPEMLNEALGKGRQSTFTSSLGDVIETSSSAGSSLRSQYCNLLYRHVVNRGRTGNRPATPFPLRPAGGARPYGRGGTAMSRSIRRSLWYVRGVMRRTVANAPWGSPAFNQERCLTAVLSGFEAGRPPPGDDPRR